MEKTRIKQRLDIYIIFMLLLFMAASVYGFYKTEYIKKPVIKQKVNSLDTGYLYDFYVSSTPNINGREYYGTTNASITIVAFLDFRSESSRRFMSDIFPKLQEEYINNGRLRFYHKSHISADDFTEGNDNLLYSESLACVKSIKREIYYPFYFELFSISAESITNLIEKYNISLQQFNDCMEHNQFDELKEDMSEVENFGMVGINPRFYIGIDGRDNAVIDGVPNYDKFKRAIKEFEFIRGD